MYSLSIQIALWARFEVTSWNQVKAGAKTIIKPNAAQRNDSLKHQQQTGACTCPVPCSADAAPDLPSLTGLVRSEGAEADALPGCGVVPD
jgi:hypothetical protein